MPKNWKKANLAIFGFSFSVVIKSSGAKILQASSSLEKTSIWPF